MVFGYLTSTNIPRVDGLSTRHPGLGASHLSCKLRTIGVFRFSRNNAFIIICNYAKYTYFIFSLTFSFFILLNVLFIVSFVNKLSFMFPLALLIVILISIFWYSRIVSFLCIYF